MNADDIPRYADPSPDELNELFRDPTPAESMRDCEHRDACLRMVAIYLKREFNPMRMADLEEAAVLTDCDNCLEWE